MWTALTGRQQQRDWQEGWEEEAGFGQQQQQQQKENQGFLRDIWQFLREGQRLAGRWRQGLDSDSCSSSSSHRRENMKRQCWQQQQTAATQVYCCSSATRHGSSGSGT
jgi:hypothetical protein